MTASVQESLENHFKQHPIPIKPSAESLARLRLLQVFSKTWTQEKQEARFKVPITSLYFIKRIIRRTQAIGLRPFI